MRGVWQPQSEASFDVCVIDTDAQSSAHCSVNAVLVTLEREKKYILKQHRLTMLHFPFVLSVDGLLAHEARLQGRKQVGAWGC